MKKAILGFLLLIFSASFLVSWTKDAKGNLGEKVYPSVIIGGGVGAMTSSVYLSRAQVLPLVLEGKTPGGVITQSHLVENWPGEVAISGEKIASKLKTQAEKNGAVFLGQEVVGIDFSTFPYVVTARDVFDEDEIYKYKTYSIVVAMGTTPNYLNIPGEEEYWGRGVSNCATCDGSLYKGKTVAIVGGGDSAITEADYLSNIAKKVNVFVRKDQFRASDKALKDSVLKKSNVEVFYNTTVEEIHGDGSGIHSISVKNKETLRKEAIDGLFLAVGSTPNTDLFKGKIKLDDKGYVVLEKGQETSKKGVYAIGDISDPIYKQAVSASGDGAKAAMQIEKYLRDLQLSDERITLLRPADYMPPESEISPKSIAKESSVIEITSMQQFQKELNSNTPVIVDFYADWCTPCNQLAPGLEKKAKELSGDIKFLKVNKDKMDSLFKEYNVRSMPTAIIFSNKKEINRKLDVDTITDYLNVLSKKSDDKKKFNSALQS